CEGLEIVFRGNACRGGHRVTSCAPYSSWWTKAPVVIAGSSPHRHQDKGPAGENCVMAGPRVGPKARPRTGSGRPPTALPHVAPQAVGGRAKPGHDTKKGTLRLCPRDEFSIPSAYPDAYGVKPGHDGLGGPCKPTKSRSQRRLVSVQYSVFRSRSGYSRSYCSPPILPALMSARIVPVLGSDLREMCFSGFHRSERTRA